MSMPKHNIPADKLALMPKHNIPADKLALYEKLIATNPKIKRKGAANPYTSLNGHMFSYLDPSSTAICVVNAR